MKRTFIAFNINPSETVKETYEILRQRLRTERINWIDPGKLHITVKFLGDTEEDSLPAITDTLSQIIAPYKPFRINLHGLGVFRNIHDPHVIWMGCRIEDPMISLKAEIEESLGNFGFEPEKRGFSPHLTLGRIKMMRQTNQLSELIAIYKDQQFQELLIDELIFYESKLTSAGSVYTPIEVFRLK